MKKVLSPYSKLKDHFNNFKKLALVYSTEDASRRKAREASEFKSARKEITSDYVLKMFMENSQIIKFNFFFLDENNFKTITKDQYIQVVYGKRNEEKLQSLLIPFEQFKEKIRTLNKTLSEHDNNVSHFNILLESLILKTFNLVDGLDNTIDEFKTNLDCDTLKLNLNISTNEIERLNKKIKTNNEDLEMQKFLSEEKKFVLQKRKELEEAELQYYYKIEKIKASLNIEEDKELLIASRKARKDLVEQIKNKFNIMSKTYLIPKNFIEKIYEDFISK